MFTGIIEELGTVEAIDRLDDAIRLTIRASTVLEGTGLGDSIAVNGVCLTVVTSDDALWTADVMQESIDKSSIGDLVVGDTVNLERAVTVEKRLGGHVVQGHVDTVGTVIARDPSEHWEYVEVGFPAGFGRYLVDKGSVTIDGISLTVIDPTETSFKVSLIPETLTRTTMGNRPVGSRVNLEADVIAKHVEKLLASANLLNADSITKLMKEQNQ
ncbi:riboflavin synthase [Nocardioides jejuensis]|uniref:Riboflavin synthase n=1 Tax=Nocardioides jejuensis TaxID=2502782 RepID=A0A4R1BWA4_9ACTN|nr:riboflavin synthase [Nocardioides jejuensis]TCJ22323.1 riboflavin synthase [Nocardioides jejuensis]